MELPICSGTPQPRLYLRAAPICVKFSCSAFGETQEEALKEIKIAMELWLEIAKEHGDAIPEPRSQELLASMLNK